MARERTPEETIALGDWAKQLSADPNFIGLCNGIVADAMAGLLSASPGSDEAKLVHMEMLAADRMKGALKKLENDAAMARRQIELRNNARR